MTRYSIWYSAPSGEWLVQRQTSGGFWDTWSSHSTRELAEVAMMSVAR